MTILLVRHARAGDRDRWPGPDIERPLTKRGRAQADALAALLPTLASGSITTVLSSPYVRCRETVEPLARAAGTTVGDRAELAEGARLPDVLALVAGLGAAPVVLCSHGDVIGDVVGWLAERGLVTEARCAKGSTWVIERGPGGEPTAARYVDAP